MALLTKTSEEVVQAFEVFQVRLDENDLEEFTANPRVYLARLLEDAGITVNGVYFDPEVIGGNGDVQSIKMYHCLTRPNRSKHMIIKEI